MVIVPLAGSLIAIIPALIKKNEKSSETTFIIGITLEQYEARLKQKEAEIREQLSNEVELEQEKRSQLEAELAAVEGKLANLEESGYCGRTTIALRWSAYALSSQVLF